MNTEVIAVSQDPLGIQGRRIWSSSGDYSMLVEVCDPARPDQRWRYDPPNHKIVSEGGLCLDVANCGEGLFGNPATLTPCSHENSPCNDSTATQQWYPQSNGSIISGLSTNQCLDVYDFVGPFVQAYPCNGGANQKWVINATDNTVRVSDGRCLTFAQVIPAGLQEIWAVPVEGDAMVVVLFNRYGDGPVEITVDFGMASIKSTVEVRDLWLHEELGSFTQSFTATVPSHGVVMVKMY